MTYEKLMPEKEDRCKSFYNKATVRNNGREYVLESYGTPVCAVRDGQVLRLWSGYSATTMRHVNSFIRQYADITVAGGKKWWDAQRVVSLNA